jgi:ABC-type branched-subunit amino acid transport system ATPase component
MVQDFRDGFDLVQYVDWVGILEDDDEAVPTADFQRLLRLALVQVKGAAAGLAAGQANGDPVLLQHAEGGFVRRPEQFRHDAALEEEALQVLRFVGLDWASSHSPSALSFGNQRLVEMARSLMAQPKLLLLDEPTAGMSPEETQETAQLIRELSKTVTVLLVEQNARMALGLAHKGYVLETGKIVLQGQAAELIDNEHVKKAYLGK